MNCRVIVLVFILANSLIALSANIRRGFATVHQFRMHGIKLSFIVMRKLILFTIIISTVNFASAQSRFSVRTNIGTTFTTDNGNWNIGYSGAFNGNRTSWFSYDYSYMKKIHLGYQTGLEGAYAFKKWKAMCGFNFYDFYNKENVKYTVVKDNVLQKGEFIGKLDLRVSQFMFNVGAQFRIANINKRPLELQFLWEKTAYAFKHNSRLIQAQNDTFKDISQELGFSGYMYYGRRNYFCTALDYEFQLGKKWSVIPTLGYTWGDPFRHWLPFTLKVIRSWHVNDYIYHRFFSTNFSVKYSF